jgi:hypothetical protein
VRQTRACIATQIYTPSKTQPVIQNYRLNVRKAAEKLIDATSRPHDCKIDFMHENIIIEFSAGAFCLLKNSWHLCLMTSFICFKFGMSFMASPITFNSSKNWFYA